MATRADERPLVGGRGGHSLDRLLRPRSIAVIGASPDPTKRGHRAVRALIDKGYAGRIVPVHPDGGHLLGLPVARGPHDLDAPADLAIVCTPAPTVPRVLGQWAEAGTGGSVVLAGGFRESGEAGSNLESQLREVVARTGMRVIGPNTSGILNVPLGLDLMGFDVAPGPLSLVAQSGNMALALVTEAARIGLGFAFVVGLGNESDVGFHECLEFLADDDATRVILVHAEGFRNGAAFLAAAQRASRVKPVVVLKGGRTERGSVAARSHTGAIAGAHAVLRAGLRQAGIILADRTDELLPLAATLATQPAADVTRGIAILSDGGGHATIAVDELLGQGHTLASLQPATMQRLRAQLGEAATVSNPVDLAGAADRDPMAFAHALETIADDPSVATVLVAGLFGGYAIRFAESLLDAEMETARRLPVLARGARVALVVHSLYADDRPAPLGILREAGVPVLGSLETACRCAGATVERGAGLARLQRLDPSWPASPTHANRSTAPDGDERSVFATARREARSVLLEPEARALVEAWGVPLVPAVLLPVPVEDESTDRIASLGAGPYAVRIVSGAVVHKTEAGGVQLGVPADGVARVAAGVCEAVREWSVTRALPPDIRGVIVAPMLPPPIAELLVGIVRDPQMGPVLTIGAGGTGVELHRDSAMRVLPVAIDEVREMLGELRIAPLLAGHRGAVGADVDAIARAALALADCALAHAGIAEIEVNPLFACADRAIAVDVRILLR